MKILVLLAAAAGLGYFVYKNAKVDPQFSRTDGWEQTARTRRQDYPPSAVPA